MAKQHVTSSHVLRWSDAAERLASNLRDYIEGYGSNPGSEARDIEDDLETLREYQGGIEKLAEKAAADLREQDEDEDDEPTERGHADD